MKRKILWVLATSILVIAVGEVIFVVHGNSGTKPYLDTRKVGEHFVWEYRRNGTEMIDLFKDNSHRALVTETVSTKNGGWMGFTLDINKLNLRDPDTFGMAIHETEESVLSMVSSYMADGERVVWDEKHDQLVGKGRYDTIRMYDYRTKIETTIESHPYPSTITVYKPWINGDYIVYVKEDGEDISSIYLYDINAKTSKRITPESVYATSPKKYGNYICWVDFRNQETTGLDIYGYDISKQQEFPIVTTPGSQSRFFMNDRYVLFKGAETATDHNNLGVYVFDLQNKTTTTITTNEINEARISSGSNADDTYVCWDEKVTNNNGTFWAVAYKKVSDSQSTFVTDTNTLDYHQAPDMVTQSYVGWRKGELKNSTGIPYLYDLSTQNNLQLDENSTQCLNIFIDNKYAMWTRWRQSSGSDYEELNICGCELP